VLEISFLVGLQLVSAHFFSPRWVPPYFFLPHPRWALETFLLDEGLPDKVQ